MAEKITLSNEDWDALLPSKDFMLGTVKLALRPLTLIEITMIVRTVKGAADVFKNEGINQENYNTLSNMAIITDVVITSVPDIISDCCGLAVEDISKLPIEWAINLVSELVAINLESKDSLTKNLQAFTTIIKGLEMTPGK